MTSTAPVRTQDELLHWLALRLAPGLGAKRAVELLERFGSPVAIFRASREELEGAGLSGMAARSIESGCSFEEAAEQMEKARANGIKVVTFQDAAYPDRLRNIYDPPLLLFVRGRVELLDTVMAAIVGSRRASPYGLTVAEKLGTDLAAAGMTVISGMARGIDTAAHLGALASGGNTAAVFGCGVDVIYPAENRKLAERIEARGVLASEFPLGTPAYPQNFPVRNRIVSGLSSAVIVVEGAQYSGSLVTARLALDQGREVLAVPGNITTRYSFGPNLLIKQGAHLVQSASDVLDNLSLEDRRRLALSGQTENCDESGSGSQASLPLGGGPLDQAHPMGELARQVIDLLRVDEPIHLDFLIDRLVDSSPSEIISVLFELEIAGRARQLAGRNYVKVWTE